ncbi:ribosomal biogenesis GTPase [Neisseria gonorrhoeae]|uniref:Ribosomal biogenesis GTPase n=1 Tax=Neisseria gonorrhoeae TaxID=485 RepID=A0A378W1N7_NEIGO|nr:ribosomal biogenesis GTPase [Neisseria gonorrhoeae]
MRHSQRRQIHPHQWNDRQKSAKTGNEPGITKAEQRLFLADDFWLYDTPGMLWPKIIVEESGYNLAAGGAVGRNALDEEEVALELLDYLRRHYLPMLQERYQADKDPSSHWDDNSWLEWIAKNAAQSSAADGSTTKSRRKHPHGLPRRQNRQNHP